jgi:hypothetical protein
MITGTGVHDRPESAFTIDWNECSRSTGIGVHDPLERAINRRFMIVPPALPSDGHAGQLEQTSKEFPCLRLETANMRVDKI